MAKNYSGKGDVLDYVAGGAVASGAVVIMGDQVGIALSAAAAIGDEILVQVEGAFTGVPKSAGTAISKGDKVSWDASASAFSKGITPATGDVIGCGFAAADATSAATTMDVVLTENTGTAQ